MSGQRAAIQPEADPRWMQFYAHAIRDALRKSNSRKRETLEALIAASDGIGDCCVT